MEYSGLLQIFALIRSESNRSEFVRWPHALARRGNVLGGERVPAVAADLSATEVVRSVHLHALKEAERACRTLLLLCRAASRRRPSAANLDVEWRTVLLVVAVEVHSAAVALAEPLKVEE